MDLPGPNPVWLWPWYFLLARQLHRPFIIPILGPLPTHPEQPPWFVKPGLLNMPAEHNSPLPPALDQQPPLQGMRIFPAFVMPPCALQVEWIWLWILWISDCWLWICVCWHHWIWPHPIPQLTPHQWGIWIWICWIWTLPRGVGGLVGFFFFLFRVGHNFHILPWTPEELSTDLLQTGADFELSWGLAIRVRHWVRAWAEIAWELELKWLQTYIYILFI